jgi:hypothetical protein
MTGKKDMDVEIVCPICSHKSLRHHCRSKPCTWFRCVNKHCSAVLNGRENRGYAWVGGALKWLHVVNQRWAVRDV